MLPRQFGPQNNDRSPTAGYPPLAPKFYSDRVGLPYATPRISYVRQPDYVEEMLEFSPALGETSTGVELETLPVSHFEKVITDSVRDNPVTIIVAETGAGKSTRVPQMLLNAGWARTYLTQPRRAAAYNVYDRIKSELGITHGEEKAETLISYKTAGLDEREGPEDARIIVATDGLQLVKELDNNGIVKNEVLIIDEVHEWNANIEVLTAWTKREMARKPHLRVVIMSATMEADRLANYFSDVCPKTPSIIDIPGRTHTIEAREAPRSTFLKETLKEAKLIHDRQVSGEDTDGRNGILVFLPGKREIKDGIRKLRHMLPPEIAKKAVILPLHAKLLPEERQAALDHYEGIKIILSTNVAQTSLTIPDVISVVDTGYERRKELDDGGIQGLLLHPVSQADCDQRKGRTGRVGPGRYVLTGLDESTKRPYVSYIQRDKFPTAEILRTDVVRNTLRIASIGLDIEELDFFHPLQAENLRRSKAVLHGLGAVAMAGEITELGREMNDYRLRAQLALMVVSSKRFSPQTQAYVAAVAASIESGGLRYYDRDSGTAWKELSDETQADPLTQLDIFIAMQNRSDAILTEYDLDVRNFESARELYFKINKQHKIKFDVLLPPRPEEREDIKSCIMAGYVDSIYTYAGDGKYLHIGSDDKPRELSRRSSVGNRAYEAVIGDPYYIEKADGEIIDVLENVTAISMSELGRVATGLRTWQSEGYKVSAGRFFEIKREFLHDIKLNNYKEVLAEPSPKLREAVLAYVAEHPLSQQKHLREIKKELERLAHLAKDYVQPLTHDAIKELIHRAAPADITDPTLVDHNLRQIIEAEGISLDLFVGAERRERIVASAPEELLAGDNNVVTLKLTYSNSTPIARHYRHSDILELHDEIFLPDGRQVYFSNPEGRRCTLLELKSKLFEQLKAI